MRAVIRQSNRASLASVPSPRRPPGWLRLRVLLAGICRTDVHAADGTLPTADSRILGHEMVGEVAEADLGSGFEPGQRVTMAPLLPCGACESCARLGRCGESRMLGVDLDGAFAEEVVVPASAAHRVPRELPLRRAAYVEPIAATHAIVNAPIRKEQRGRVLGEGRIAELSIRLLLHLGFTAERRECRPDRRYDYVVETSGTEASLDEALRSVTPGGVVVLKSRPPARVALDMARAVRNDVTLCAVSYGPWPQAIRLAGELAVDDLLGEIYPLERVDAALALMRQRPDGPKLFLSPERP